MTLSPPGDIILMLSAIFCIKVAQVSNRFSQHIIPFRLAPYPYPLLQEKAICNSLSFTLIHRLKRQRTFPIKIEFMPQYQHKK
jgi:hypothetical protein